VNSDFYTCVTVLFICIVLMFTGSLIGSYATANFYRKEAVKRGFAEWAVDDSGRATWNWKEQGRAKE